MLLLTATAAAAQGTCPGTATLTVFVENLTAAPTVDVTLDGELAAGAVTCDGPGATSYSPRTMTCTGSGVARCGQLDGLRPGAWVHRLAVSVPGSAVQRQAQAGVLVAGEARETSNAVTWSVYPRTFVVEHTTADALWATITEAAAFTAAGPGPALVTFSETTFPGAGAPQRIQLVQHPCPAPEPRHHCPPVGTLSDPIAGLCFTGDRIVVDALDRHAQTGGVILSVDTCGRSVVRVSGSGNTLRGFVLEGSRKPDPTSPCQADTLAIGGPAARRNRIEHSVVLGPTCGDAISVEHDAGQPDDTGAGDNVIEASRITGAADKGVKVDFGGVATIARSCVHDNRNGGIQSTLGGHVVAAENVVQHNLGGAGQNGLNVLHSCPENQPGCTRTAKSTLATQGNVVRFSGGRGLSVRDNAEALFEHDYVANNQFKGSVVETTDKAPVDATGAALAPAARFRGVALVCNRHVGLTKTCKPPPGGEETPCTTVEDCCTTPDGEVDDACRNATQCLVTSTPDGVGAETRAAPGLRAPDVNYGDASHPGRNAFTSNKNTAKGANFLVTNITAPAPAGGSLPIPAEGNQWARCGGAAPCDVASVRADDISPSDAPVALGILSHPRAGVPTISRVTPPRPRAGDVVRVFGDGLNAIEGNPVRSSCDDVVLQPCTGETCPTGPCVNGRCPCSIENVAVQQRNASGGNGHHLAIRSRDGAPLAELEPDAVTPTMLAFHMPFDCFAPLVLEVAKGGDVASISLCDPEGCGEQPDGAPCDDGNACTLGDRCDGEGGCVGGSPRACAPPCLTCDGAGGCVPRPATAGCDDGSRCTTRDHCRGDANRCVGGEAVVCDGPCLTGACDPEAGCEPRPSDAACTTGDACTVGDHCSGEGDVCLPGTARECVGQCLTGACDSRQGCVASPASAGCDDGNACTDGDRCSGVGDTCVPGSATVCDGPCLTGTCDPEGGCRLQEGPKALTCRVVECRDPERRKKLAKLARKIDRKVERGKPVKPRMMRRLQKRLAKCGVSV